jgi:hypothetical protein
MFMVMVRRARLRTGAYGAKLGLAPTR